MIRAAIYARFSSDLQNDKSVADQIALCREICARAGMAVISTFEDRAISGSSAINRPGFQALMRAAEAKAFDAIVAEDVDRISRDQGDWHTARKRLDFLGIAIHTASGKVGKIEGSMRALMGELFIENLAAHTRRGLEAVIRDGRHAGGRAYGYATVPGKPGELSIVPEEAAIVRRIFQAFVDGMTPRQIAGQLNAEKVAPPRGRTWNASTINGNLARGSGMLLNDLYAGRIVWNKLHMVKDPATGKRVSRPNPKDQYRIVAAEHLRIIDDALWQAAQARKRAQGRPQTSRRRQPRILSGLLRCGTCGGGMASVGHRHGTARLQCSAARESGTCTNLRRVKRDDIERLTFDGLRRELAQPAAIAEYVTTYNAERRRLARSNGQDRSRLERRSAEIGRELNRLVDAIATGRVDVPTIADRINALEQERRDVAGRLAALAENDQVVALHPAALERYLAAVDAIAAMPAEMDTGLPSEFVARIRDLVSAVVVHAPPNSEALEIEIRGRLTELIGLPAFADRSGGGYKVVAREGFRQSPPGLEFAFRVA